MVKTRGIMCSFDILLAFSFAGHSSMSARSRKSFVMPSAKDWTCSDDAWNNAEKVSIMHQIVLR
jgi:hypothetical protein